ncbi:MAG: VWA domain-containing protein [Ardenticatenales bacterium]
MMGSRSTADEGRFGGRAHRRALIPCAAVLAALALAAGPAATPASAADGVAYHLVDTWTGRPWTPAAGRYGDIADITSTPDGTVYVLDNRMVAGRAPMLHVLRPDGTPITWLALPEEPDVVDPPIPYRIDAGADGRVYVLSMSQHKYQDSIVFLVDRLAPTGALEARYALRLEPPRGYTDIAVRSDGRIYLTRVGATQWCYEPGTPAPRNQPGEPPSYAIDVIDPATAKTTVLTPPELAVPLGLDIDADGTAIVINYVVPPCSPGGGDPGDPGTPPPPSLRAAWPWWRTALAASTASSRGSSDTSRIAPSADAQASNAGASGRTARTSAVAQAAPVPGLLFMNAGNQVVGTIPWTGAEDIAVGPAGRFVSRNVEIYALRQGAEASGLGSVEDEPLYAGPLDRVYASLFLEHRVLSLDVPFSGRRLLASMNHCTFQGTLHFDAPNARPAAPVLVGSLDAPELEGPAYPVRVAAAAELRVLLGRMNILGTRPSQGYYSTSYASEGQTAQRWRADGTIRSQTGLCSGSESWLVRDVAADRDDTYSVDPNFLQRRPDDLVPAWTYWGGDVDDPNVEPFFSAVSADGGRAAVLDVGRGRVHIVGADGTVQAVWPAAPDGQIVPIDIALRGDRVYLADQARGRIVVRDLAGAQQSAFDTHDGAASVAVDTAGEVYVLGRGGWAYRYHPDGTLVAAWPMPVRDRTALDIAVDDSGRVFVNYVRYGLQGDGRWGQGTRMHEGGVWVFAPAAAPAMPPPPPDACVGVPDKWAAPRRIPLGQTVDVTLTVAGECPGTSVPADIMLVFDTSRSMGWESSLDRAKEAALRILGTLDPRMVRVGLATFDDAPTLVRPLTNDIADVRGAVAALKAHGDTQLTGALTSARLQLGDVPVPGRQRLALLFTDGVVNDVDPLELIKAGQDLTAADITLHAFVFATWELQTEDLEIMSRLVPLATRMLHVDPENDEIDRVAADIVGYRPQPLAFRELSVVDTIPANMRYVDRSAVPSADFDAAANTLTWRGIRNQPARDVLRLRYKVQPLEVGTWPTNVEAHAPYTDALGTSGQLVFPIPEVDVYRPNQKIYLPMAVRAGCVIKRRALDVVLVLDASSSMEEPSATGVGTKLDAARAAAAAFLDRIDPAEDRAAVVSFNTSARRVVSLTADVDRLKLGLAAIESAEGTRIDLGLSEAAAALEARRPSALPAVIVLTDGLQTNPPGNATVIAAAAGLTDGGAVIYAIGLGASIDADLLRAVATTPDRYFASPSDAQLGAIYDAILARLSCAEDAAP